MSDLLLIRADASPEMGTGHVMRCLALAEQWLYCGGTAQLLAVDLPPALAKRAEDLGVQVVACGHRPGSPEDARETVKVANSQGATWIMADGYHFDAEFQRALKDAAARLLWVDDFGHALEYCADLVLNQNLSASPALYPALGPGTHLLLGCRFALLRREFLRWQHWPRQIPDHAGRLLVTLGGSDPANVTAKVIQALRELGNDAPTATIVTGGGNLHYASHRIALHDTRHRLVRDATNMPELMADTDFAIAAGGTTAWELAFMGLPSLLFTLADNQADNCRQLDRQGVAINLGRPESMKVADLARAVATLAAANPQRRQMSQKARALVDGNGSFRVWLHLHEQTLRLRPATEADCRRVYDWANAPDVRAVSFESAPIAWESHVLWFQSKLKDAHVRFWLALDISSQPIGMVRFDLAGPQATISVCLDAGARGKNWGSLLICSACRKLLQEQPETQSILAWIKPDNEPSKRAFQKAGFVESAQNAVNGQPALVYQLNRA